MRDINEFKNNSRIIWDYFGDTGGIGMISTPSWQGSVIWSTEAGWEHVSVAPKRKSLTPSWDDMCFVKRMFWKDDEAVIQIHPREEDYINNMPNCLHLWRCNPPLLGVSG